MARRMLRSLIASSIAERTRRVNRRDASAGQRCRARLPGVGRGWSTETFALLVSPMSDVTRILSAIEQGDPHAAEQLLPLVYDELRKLAAAKLAQEKPGQTLQATALVHEAYLRLVDVAKVQAGTVGAISSPPRPRRCGGFWSIAHGGKKTCQTRR